MTRAVFVLKGVVVGVALGVLVSGLVGWAVNSRLVPINSVWDFVVSPGLLAFAATSDLAQKPPAHEIWLLFLLLNVLWYGIWGLLVPLFVGLWRHFTQPAPHVGDAKG